MSKERLEEIKRQFNINKSRLIRLGRNTHVTDDYEWLIEQAERVQGLLDQTGHNFEVLRKLDSQNKRYREALLKMNDYDIELGDMREDMQEKLLQIKYIKDKTLEESE